MPNVELAALVKGRGRRVAMDRDRQARDSRVERAAGRVFLGVEQRGCAGRAARDAELGIGMALRDLLTEQIGLEDVAELCDLNLSEVRRLSRMPAAAAAGPGAVPAQTAHQTGGEVAGTARRAE